MSVGTLRVVERTAEGTEPPTDTFAIEDVLRTVETQSFDDIFREVAEAPVGRVAGLPVYQVLRLRLALSFAQNRKPPMAVTHLVVCYRALRNRVEVDGVTELTCDEALPDQYRAVVADVAAECDISVQGARPSGRAARVGYILGLVGVVGVVLDLLASLVARWLFSWRSVGDVVFVPHVNRFDSTEPVLREMECDSTVVLPVATLDWLRHRCGKYERLKAYDPVPLDCLADLRTVGQIVVSMSRLTVAELGGRHTELALVAFLNDEFEVQMNRTVSYALGNAFRHHLHAVPYVLVSDAAFERLDASRLAVGSLGSQQEAILRAGIDRGLKTFHVPHSATIGYELTPPAETVHFVASDLAIDYLVETGQTSSIERVVAVGRPQLTALSEASITPREDWLEGAVRVVVATQRHPSHVRRTFARDVLDGLEDAPIAVDVVVKLHPNDSADFYADLIADRPFRVRVVSDDLHGWLAGADLTVTINSNVGLESLVLGTPVVTVVEWAPLVRARPYTLGGPVPVLESRSAVASFFADLDADGVEAWAEEQRAFVREHYLPDVDPAKRIAKLVCGTDVGAATHSR